MSEVAVAACSCCLFRCSGIGSARSVTGRPLRLTAARAGSCLRARSGFRPQRRAALGHGRSAAGDACGPAGHRETDACEARAGHWRRSALARWTRAFRSTSGIVVAHVVVAMWGVPPSWTDPRESNGHSLRLRHGRHARAEALRRRAHCVVAATERGLAVEGGLRAGDAGLHRMQRGHA